MFLHPIGYIIFTRKFQVKTTNKLIRLTSQERRQAEFERSVQQQLDLLTQKRTEHREELRKEAQLHRRLLQERRREREERRLRLAADVVVFCMDMAVMTVDYKTKSGDK